MKLSVLLFFLGATLCPFGALAEGLPDLPKNYSLYEFIDDLVRVGWSFEEGRLFKSEDLETLAVDQSDLIKTRLAGQKFESLFHQDRLQLAVRRLSDVLKIHPGGLNAYQAYIGWQGGDFASGVIVPDGNLRSPFSSLLMNLVFDGEPFESNALMAWSGFKRTFLEPEYSSIELGEASRFMAANIHQNMDRLGKLSDNPSLLAVFAFLAHRYDRRNSDGTEWSLSRLESHLSKAFRKKAIRVVRPADDEQYFYFLTLLAGLGSRTVDDTLSPWLRPMTEKDDFSLLDLFQALLLSAGDQKDTPDELSVYRKYAEYLRRVWKNPPKELQGTSIARASFLTLRLALPLQLWRLSQGESLSAVLSDSSQRAESARNGTWTSLIRIAEEGSVSIAEGSELKDREGKMYQALSLLKIDERKPRSPSPCLRFMATSSPAQ